MSRRGRTFARQQPCAAAGDGPIHLVLDSTGRQLFGQGEWDDERHCRARRRWLKLHVAVNATTGETTAHVLTDGNADDAAQVPALLAQADGTIAIVTTDGAYGGERTCAAVAARQPDPSLEVVVPPRASAKPSTADAKKQSPRDRHIRAIAERGRIGWQRATGYGRRSLGETVVDRYRHLIGPKLRARTPSDQHSEVALAARVLNRMIRAVKPASVRVS